MARPHSKIFWGRRLCKSVQESMGIPAVTAMYEENPGVDLFREDIYIIKSEESVRGMADAISKIEECSVGPGGVPDKIPN